MSIVVCNGQEVVFVLNDGADLTQWPLVVDGDHSFIVGLDFERTVVENVVEDVQVGDKYVDGVFVPRLDKKVLQIEELKNVINRIESDNPITPRLLRELALIVRALVVASGNSPGYGLNVAASLDAQIVALRNQIKDIQDGG